MVSALLQIGFDLRLFAATASHNVRRHTPPSSGGKTGCLFKAAGEMALVGKTTLSSNLREFLAPRRQRPLRRVNLAAQKEMLGSLPHQIRKTAMEMEWAQMRMLGDFVQRRVRRELFLHELERW